MKNPFQRGLFDYLETLQMAGITEIPFERESPDSELSHNVEVAEMPKKKVTETKTETKIETESKMESDDRPLLLKQVAEKVAKCKKCAELAATRTQTVFGVGNPYSELVFLGEAPGADEDRQGIPFVGRAGQLLTDIITKGMKIKREDVYICNILRCRPPGNRNPSPEEAANCSVFLNRTFEIIQPKYICCLGSIAATNLLETTQTIGRLRGKVHDYNGVKVVCTYHPAYLLRNPSAKSATWEDIKLLMQIMGMTVQ